MGDVATPADIRRERTYLHAHRSLMRAGLSLTLPFVWVFLFAYTLNVTTNLDKAILYTLIMYSISQVVMMLLTPSSAAHLRRGVRTAMVFGAILASAALIVLGAYFVGNFSQPFGWGIALFACLLGAYRALYWIPYRLHAVEVRGVANSLYEVFISLMPAFAGVTIATSVWGPIRLLFGAGVLILLSIVPIFFLADTREKFSWRYAETYGKLFDERYRLLSGRSILDGVQSAALFLLWPLAVFLIVGRSYLIMGFILSASLIIMLLLRSLYKKFWGSFVGTKGQKGSLALDILFSVSGWVLRVVAGSPFMVVFADTYSYVSAPRGAPDPLTCEHPADSGSYLDEYTALQEIGLGFGRLIMCAFTAVMIITGPLPVALALSLLVAGCSAGVSAYLAHKVRTAAF